MEATFLTEQQIWGDDQGKGQLQVMKGYGTKTGMSDLAVLLGGAVAKSAATSEGQRSSYVWSASSIGSGDVRTVTSSGERHYYYPYRRTCGARPALPSSVASSIRLSEAKPSRKISGMDVVEYGEYPQTIAFADVEKEEGRKRAENLRAELEQAFSRNQLQKTGKTYTFDNAKKDAYDTPFSAESHAEYQHKGKRYIRVEAHPFGNDSILSNGVKPQAGQSYWIEVKPIEWLKDPSGTLVAKQALFAGVQFDRKKKYDGDFENTDMKQYLQNYFAKEMVAGRNVGVPAAIGPNTAAVISGRESQRQEAANAPSWPL